MSLTHQHYQAASSPSPLLIATLTSFLFLFLNIPIVQAQVTGACGNCHTMHNSQNGSTVVHSGVGAGWNGATISGGDSNTPQSNLLVSDCVGCHSNAGSETIVNLGTTRVPIVYNIAEPDKPLAGGNFYWVATNGDGHGHNVAGISSKDTFLSTPPGGLTGLCQPCHFELTKAQGLSMGGWGQNKGGCEACHVARHHATGSNTVVGQEEGWYRFLGSAMYRARNNITSTPTGVVGIEDDDWEQTVGPGDHNVYQGAVGYTNKGISGGLDEGSIGQICIGCHGQFHHAYSTGGGMQDANNAWIRHPADILIPDSGEYAGLVTYDPSAPVGLLNVTDVDANFQAIDHNRNVVNCLSCHRAHGSPYQDMLRWDYNSMNAHNSGDINTGCFSCHRAKDT